MNVREYLGFCAIALLLPTPLLAQELPSPGERVRVWGPSTAMNLMVNENLECELFAVRGDTLVFEMSRSRTQVAVMQDQVRRLDVRRSRSPSRGAWLGAAAGLAVGVVVGLVSANAYCSGDVSCSGRVDLGWAVVFGGVGAGIGALVGHTYPGGRWEEVEFRREPSASPGRVGVAIRIQH